MYARFFYAYNNIQYVQLWEDNSVSCPSRAYLRGQCLTPDDRKIVAKSELKHAFF